MLEKSWTIIINSNSHKSINQLCPLTPCSRSRFLGLEGLTLLFPLKSLFNDLNLVGTGDFCSSSSLICLGMSIKATPSGLLLVEAIDEDDELDVSAAVLPWWPSSTQGPKVLTWVSFPQINTLVGKFGTSTFAPEFSTIGACSKVGTETEFDATGFLHKGQVEWDWNHISMQSTWNPWLHLGKSLVFSDSETSHRHTAHSNPSLNSLGSNTMTGMVLRTAGSNPRRRVETTGISWWPAANSRRRRRLVGVVVLFSWRRYQNHLA